MYQNIYRKLVWVGASYAAFSKFPKSANIGLGFQLQLVQYGNEPHDFKPMPAIGPGVRELRLRTTDGQFRVIYVLFNPEFVHILHCFTKKTQKTSGKDIALARKRYKEMRHGYKDA